MAATAFDKLARSYDEQWTRSPVGRLQRDAVWRHIEGLFPRGGTVLDLGCGTGEDALHLMNGGIRVEAVDSSSERVRVARERGVDARTLSIEDVGALDARFDGVISNFGAINCVEDVSLLRGALARLVRPGGSVAICAMGRFCLWETAYHLLSFRPGKAFRRFSRRFATSSIGVPVYYPSVGKLVRALRPDFELLRCYGVGVAVPPSYIRLSTVTLRWLAAMDRWSAHWPLVWALSDHRLLIFVRTRI